MKEILDQYGAIFLAFFVLLAILTSIYSGKIWKGLTFPQLIGQTSQKELDIKYEDSENLIYEDYLLKKGPELKVHSENIWSNTEYGITSIFEILDYRGIRVMPELKVVPAAGTQMQGDKILFKKAGIYEIDIKARDKDGRNMEAIVKVPVQEKMRGL